MTEKTDQFVVHRLRSKPVKYTVTIRHFVSGGEWMMGVSLGDLAPPDDEQRRRVAQDLRDAADRVENGQWVAT